MPSGQDLVSRLRDETRQSLAQHLLRFEVEFKALQERLSASISSVDQISLRLSEAGSVDLSSVEAVVSGALTEARLEGSRRREEEQSFLAHFIHEMRQKETQEEILTLLLDRAQRYAPKLALFVTRGNQFCGWSSRGFSAESATKICSAVLGKDEGRLLGKALEVDALTTADEIGHESGLLRAFAGEAESPWHAFPMKAIQRPVAVLLAAPAGGRNCDLESLCILMDLTGLCVENIALKILQDMKGARPAAAASDGQEASTTVLSQEKPQVPEPVGGELPDSSSQEAPADVVQVAEVEDVVAASPAPQVESEFISEEPAEIHKTEAETASSDAANMAAEEGAPEEVAATVETEAEAESTAEPVVEPEEGAVESEASEEIIQPIEEEIPAATADVAEAAAASEAMGAPVEVPLDTLKAVRSAGLREVQPLSEEEKLHADAKRFARLLASEIKLYNEQRVQEGRDNRDIYVRLKRDIDRSREMYEKRVSPVVTRRVDYFHDEIIRILGNNDPSALGSDYPGPHIES